MFLIKQICGTAERCISYNIKEKLINKARFSLKYNKNKFKGKSKTYFKDKFKYFYLISLRKQNFIKHVQAEKSLPPLIIQKIYNSK